MLRRSLIRTVFLLLVAASAVSAATPPWSADRGDGTYRNPVLFADYSDPDVVRTGDDYWLVASSFNAVPGLPILHSKDLVNWSIVAHAADRLPPEFDAPQHGNGLWAPSLRVHDGWFWIYVGDPDRGIFMTRARDARGPWEPLSLVKAAKGWIDPCPFWDDDGSMVLVHGWAKSRAGFNSVLTVNRMSADGRKVLDDGTMVFDGHATQPTIEGPKFHKRNGWYYIFAPAGGVKNGWQTVLRSRNVYGPYEEKIVLEQGSTAINGPHQGAWVKAPDGSSWFVHFQDRGAYGRVVLLEPMSWVNDWPVIGRDRGDGRGEPLLSANKPHRSAAISDVLQTSDEFDSNTLGPQWQWPGNPKNSWAALKHGSLQLQALLAAGPNLWSATNLLLQKFSAPSFEATAAIDPSGLRTGERSGLIVMGSDYSALVVERTAEGLVLRHVIARHADGGAAESAVASIAINGPLQLRVSVAPGAICRFSYSTDGAKFTPSGGAFVARPGRWIGAKVGLFAEGGRLEVARRRSEATDTSATRDLRSATRDLSPAGSGSAKYDWFRVGPSTRNESADFIVAADGSGDFTTIQAAIDALPNDEEVDRTILIRDGEYREKVMIARSHVALVGEARDKTRIVFAELRKNWRATHPDDYGAAVINIANGASDIVLANLTVQNDYGRTHGGEHDHQFAIRSMDTANRIAILDANVVADGGDTLSLWNAESGLTYYADSYFEGWVDYVCPRGWAYITNSRFFGHNDSASIWHDGSKHEEAKLVIRSSQFDGVPGFPLGRHHRDAQFYLLDSAFSANMADRPIYPAPAPDPVKWGERIYYSNDHRAGGDYAWFADNLRSAAGSPRSEDITAGWTFGGRWDVAAIRPVLPFAAIPQPENGWRFVDPAGVTLRWTHGRNATASRVYFGTTANPDDRGEQIGASFDTGALKPGTTYYWRVDSITPGGIVAGKPWSFRTDPRALRIALVGDSTMTKKSGYGRGFEARVGDDAAVLNLAWSGRSSKSYANEGHWRDVLREKPTYALIQFGHNDVPGKGLARETDPPTFRANVARYVDEARAAGIKPILVTPLTRRIFRSDGRIHSDLGDYANATREVAAEKHVPLIDLHSKSIELLDRLGPSISPAISPLKPDGTMDKTHLNTAGSALIAALVANELRQVVPELACSIPVSPLPQPVVPWSVRVAESVMKRTPDPLLLDVAGTTPKWDYTQGLVLLAIQELAHRTGDPRYSDYVKAYFDRMIDPDGTIHAYRIDEYSLDRVNAGKELFDLYAQTHDEKYRKAIETLRAQFRGQPRTSDGGFWHKKRYPYQMWLDGLYMGVPFLARYGRTFNEPAVFDEVIDQFVRMEKHARDPKTGLMFHGWDESRQQRWADPKSGVSPVFWGRAMGWYGMGLVEALDWIPQDHPRRGELITILQRFAAAITSVQDSKSGAWWLVLDQPGRDRNYLESSSTAMFAFVLLKASRLGYIDPQYAAVGRRAYEGALKEFVTVDDKGLVDINRTIAVAGLGGDPNKNEKYRDGTFDYYAGETVRSNDPKAVGPFIMASMEMERSSDQ